jgi:perosamine synthetase
MCGLEAKLEIAHPLIGDEERAAVLEVLGGSELAKGPRVAAFERGFATLHSARHAVATNSGSTAILLALLAHEIGAGAEVIVPSFGFFATAAAVVWAGATPVFADIEPDGFCLDPAAVEAAVTSRTRAIMPVHLFGMPADLRALRALARRHELVLLEDAAQAHGATFEARPVGSSGTAAFSFYATKNMTTLEGGMVLTDDDTVARRMRQLRNHGRDGSGTHELLGSNFRMNELAAAIGEVQLRRLPAWNATRRTHARYLSARLEGVTAPPELPDREAVFHQYTVRVPRGARDALVNHLNERGIGARVYYGRPLHAEPAFRASGSMPSHLRETERACREVLSLPVHPALNEADLERIVRAVNAFRPRE